MLITRKGEIGMLTDSQPQSLSADEEDNSLWWVVALLMALIAGGAGWLFVRRGQHKITAKEPASDASPQSSTLISISHLKKNFGTLDVLRDISVDIHRGEVISIIGPSRNHALPHRLPVRKGCAPDMNQPVN